MFATQTLASLALHHLHITFILPSWSSHVITENVLGFLDRVVVFTLQDAAFGKNWVHSVRAAFELDFGIEDSGDDRRG